MVAGYRVEMLVMCCCRDEWLNVLLLQGIGDGIGIG